MNDGRENYDFERQRYGRVYEDDLQRRPTGDLLKEFFSNGQLLLKEEVELAKLEMKAEGKKAAIAGASFGVGGILLHTALLLFAGLIVALLWGVMELWAAVLITFLVFAIAGGVALMVARKRMEKFEPKRTVKSIKEDKEWARDTMQSIRSHRHVNA